MPPWLPVLKAALPYVSNIVAAALPVFTARRGQDATADLVSRQIAELQEAVTGNAETVKGLAAQVEQTIAALDAGEADLAQRLATLQDALARCENTASQAQARVTRLESVAAALQARDDGFEQQWSGTRRREAAVAAIALLALIVAVIALLR
jgi:chromosome segregation ATPase